ncbi:MAG TPA: DUF6130 family protein [Longimicrobium sp.]|nr:DUF6130 family protein [Longimicrobium sp.]
MTEPVTPAGEGPPARTRECSPGHLPAPVVQLASEPPPRIHADAPIAGQLALGRVVIQYCAENLRIRPVYGAAALGVSPRIGHIHVTVDDAPWHWADASDEPLIINGLPPGPHSVLIELADPTHHIIDRQTVRFVIPPKAPG